MRRSAIYTTGPVPIMSPVGLAARAPSSPPRVVTKPYEFIGFGAMDAIKPYKCIGFGAMDATKPYKFIGFWGHGCPGCSGGGSG